MTDAKIYYWSLLAFGAFFAYVTGWVWSLNEENVPRWEKLPRNLILGIIVTGIDLVWCIPHAKPLLPVSLRFYLIPTAIVCGVIAYSFLDYLFSRAIGGFFILAAYYLLHESFTFHTPILPVFSIFCYAMGFVGLFLAGKPYLLRDWIRAFPTEKGVRSATITLTALFSLLCFGLGIYHLFIA